MISRSLTWVLTVALLAVASPHAQAPTLREVLARTGAYVEDFERQLSSIVAEETYLQEVRRVVPAGAPQRPPLQRRTLRSDLLLMRPEGDVSWVQFRDVFDVDGKPVRDRDERLTALFLKPSRSTLDRVARIRRESARYNIGDIERTMNVPVLPLEVADLAAQPRFRFTVADGASTRDPSDRNDEPDLPTSPSFSVSTEVWTVRFEEVRGPTLVRTPEGRDLRSRGRLWIEPSTGRVLMGEFITQNSDVRAQLTVSYQSEPLLGLLVPVEMREQYVERKASRSITGTATYGRFRRFQVEVDERIGPIR